MFFDWLRNKVKASILGGVNDALEQLDRAGDGAQPAPVALVFATPEKDEPKKLTRARSAQ